MLKILFSTLIVGGISSYAQVKTNVPDVTFTHGEHEESAGYELRLGALQLITNQVAELSYEYLYRDNFTFGVSALKSFDSEYRKEEFSITPYARYYYANWAEESSGTFLEVFGKYVSGKTTRYNETLSRTDIISYSALAAGISVGEKIVLGPVVIEGIVGGGYVFKKDNGPGFIQRVDISLGWRF